MMKTFVTQPDGGKEFVKYQENVDRDILNTILLLLLGWAYAIIAIAEDIIVAIIPDALPPIEADAYLEGGGEFWWWLLSLP